MTDRINAYNPIGICYNQVYSYDHSHSTSHKRGYKYTPFFARRSRSANDDEPDCDTDDTGLIKFLNDPLGEERYWCGNNNDREQMHKDIREYAREIMGIDVPRFTDLVEDTKSKTIFLVRASRPTLPKRIRIAAANRV